MSKNNNVIIVLAYLWIFLLLFFVFNLIGHYISDYWFFASISAVFRFFIVMIFQEIVILWIVVFLLSKLYFRISSDYAKTIKEFFSNQIKKIEYRDIRRYCFKYYLIYFLIVWILQWLMLYFQVEIPWFWWEQVVSSLFSWFDLTNASNLFIVFVLVTIVAPVTEEFVYRWFIQKLLSENLKPIWTILFSSFVFSFVHMEFGVFWPLFVLSILLSIIYYKTNSISHVIMFHILVNLISFLIMLILSLWIL
jgi:membrane protease YdiL (CAAX protease family)